MARRAAFALLLLLVLSSSTQAAVDCQINSCIFLPMIAGGSGSIGPAPDPSPSVNPTANPSTTATQPVAATSTATSQPEPSTDTATATSTPSATPTDTATATSTPGVTPTATATVTSTPVLRVSASAPTSVALYDTFELTLIAAQLTSNRFRTFPQVVFSQGEREFVVEGFYDGDKTWRARFMPSRTGSWSYSWSLDGVGGSGSFDVTDKTNLKAHGHVKVSADDKRDLIYDDGTPHYWYGSKWFHAANYGPPSKRRTDGTAEINDHPSDHWNDYIADKQIIAFLDDVEAQKLNGILLKIDLFPLENDKFSWDLDWIKRGDWIVREAAKRGIYVQIGIFNEWGREAGTFFADTDVSNRQFMNAWIADADDEAKRNYIRSIVARFAGYYNVYWELGNEMARTDKASAFKTLASQHYIPWLRQYDPYDLPIGLSEINVASGYDDVDIVFAHRGWQYQPRTSRQAWIANELYASWTAGAEARLSDNSAVRNPKSRLGYRRIFWRQFVMGGNGSSMASWLLIKTWISDSAASKAPVYAVMEDQGRLRQFIEDLPVPYTELEPLSQGAFVSALTYADDDEQTVEDLRTRAKAGEVYVTYFLVESNPGNSAAGRPDDVIGKRVAAGQATINLPADGSYRVRWYDPKTGDYSDDGIVPGGKQTIERPEMVEDLVLLVTRQ